MKILKLIILFLAFLILTIIISSLILLNYESEKIPAFMLSHNQELHPEITAAQRKDAEEYFGRFPLMFEPCFHHFMFYEKGSSELKYLCVSFLPTKNPPWALINLFYYLNNTDPEIRKGACLGLTLYLGNATFPPGMDDETISKLSEAWINEKDWHVQELLTKTLCKYDRRATEVFMKRLDDPDNKIRIVAASSLYAVTSEAKDLKALKTLYDNSDAEDRRLVMITACTLSKGKSNSVLRFGVNDKDPKTKEVALKLISMDGHKGHSNLNE